MSIEIPMASRQGAAPDATVSSVVQSAAAVWRRQAEADGREARLKASFRGFPDGSARGVFFTRVRRLAGRAACRKKDGGGRPKAEIWWKCSESVYTSKFLSYTIAMKAK